MHKYYCFAMSLYVCSYDTGRVDVIDVLITERPFQTYHCSVLCLYAVQGEIIDVMEVLSISLSRCINLSALF